MENWYLTVVPTFSSLSDVPPVLLTVEQVAELFSVQPETVTRWVREKRIEAVTTPGGQYRFRRDYVEGLVATGAVA